MGATREFSEFQVDRMEYLREECGWGFARIAAEFKTSDKAVHNLLTERGTPDQPRQYRTPLGGGFDFTADNIPEARRA